LLKILYRERQKVRLCKICMEFSSISA
jgi:hypothetical protein